MPTVYFLLRVVPYKLKDNEVSYAYYICGSAEELNEWNVETLPAKPQLKLYASKAYDRFKHNPMTDFEVYQTSFFLPSMIFNEQCVYKYVRIIQRTDGSYEYTYEGVDTSDNRVLNDRNHMVNMRTDSIFLDIDTWLGTNLNLISALYYKRIIRAKLISFYGNGRRLFFGSQPFRNEGIEPLLQRGVNAIVDLRKTQENRRIETSWRQLYEDENILYFPIPMPVDDMEYLIPSAVLTLQGLFDSGYTVYLHSDVGCVRVTTIVAVLYALQHGTTANEAIQFATKLLPNMPPVYKTVDGCIEKYKKSFSAYVEPC